MQISQKNKIRFQFSSFFSFSAIFILKCRTSHTIFIYVVSFSFFVVINNVIFVVYFQSSDKKSLIFGTFLSNSRLNSKMELLIKKCRQMVFDQYFCCWKFNHCDFFISLQVVPGIKKMLETLNNQFYQIIVFSLIMA